MDSALGTIIISLVIMSFFALSMRGAIKMMGNDFQGAIDDFNKLIDLNPGDANAYRNRAEARRVTGDEKGAKEDLAIADELKKKE